MTDQQAMEVSRRMSDPDIFPQAKESMARELLRYYRDLLSSKARQAIPTTRRLG